MTPKPDIDIDSLAEILGLLGGSRLQLLTLLDGERNVGEISRELGLSVSGASQHLGKLKAYGLVTAVRDDQVILYSRNKARISAALKVAMELLGD